MELDLLHDIALVLADFVTPTFVAGVAKDDECGGGGAIGGGMMPIVLLVDVEWSA